MKRIFFAALCAATLALAGAAHADSIHFVGSTETDGGPAIPFTVIEGANGSFTDTFLFFNAPSYSLDTYVSSANAGITFTGVTLQASTGEQAALTGTLTGSGFSFAPSAVLPSAAWELIVTGSGTVGSTYTVNFTSSFTDAPAPTSAVPEPASWALLVVGGLGLLRLRKHAGSRLPAPDALAA